jgi:hypothetical protein
VSTRDQVHSSPQIKNPKYDSVYIKKWFRELHKSLGGKFLKIFLETERWKFHN